MNRKIPWDIVIASVAFLVVGWLWYLGVQRSQIVILTKLEQGLKDASDERNKMKTQIDLNTGAVSTIFGTTWYINQDGSITTQPTSAPDTKKGR